MAAYRSPKVLATKALVERMAKQLEGRMPIGGAAHSTYSHATRIAASVESLEDIARLRSPTETAEAHAVRVANAAKKLSDNLKAVSAQFNQNTVEVIRNLSTKIDAACGLTEETRHAPEIRAYLRGLSPQERVAQLTAAVKNRDSVTLAAIANGPEYLAGIDREMRYRFLEAYKAEVAPDLVAELEAFGDADQAAQQILNVAREAITQAFDPAYVDEIMRKDAEAQAAGDRLEASMSFNAAPAENAA